MMKIRRKLEARGFSMIETLIAAALIGVVAIGIIPLFTRAMTDNMVGADYTRVTNYAKSKEEDFTRAQFTDPNIQVPVGQGNLLTTEYMDPTTLQWTTVKPLNPLAVWTRTTTITQYNIDDLIDDQMFDYPINGGASTDDTHIIQSQVEVKSVSAVGPAGARRKTIIRFLKAF
ncbi:MAG TPA: prepilin-type N-terminal cleavage/methylation domain-containing protein [Thermoanaerobaculia bacterium]|jgi:prepilin-type N-terminal cleavage/methylation domain-containing protein|nr:prepilin-type N-terminal cleavage/methylation domain-containing protein [Thermoanaerobaculia bacterium]